MNPERVLTRPATAPWGRLALTVTLPLILFAAQRVLVPGVDADKVHAVLQAGRTTSNPGMLSIVALGLGPVVWGFLLTELVAALVPRWRALRSGALPGRRSLRRAALWTTVLYALIQAYLVARWLVGVGQGASRGEPDLGVIVSGAYGWFIPLTMLTLAAGVCALLALARTIERHALGGGLSVLTLALALHACVDSLLAPDAVGVWLERSALELARSGGLVLAVLLVVALALQRPVRSAHGAPVLLPTCGLIPLTVSAAALLLPSQVATLWNLHLPTWVAQLAPGEPHYWGAYAALAVATGLLLSRLLSWPAQTQEVDGRALAIATLWSLVVLTCVAAGNELSSRLVGVSLNLVALAALPAVLLDLAAEWRLRRDHGELAQVWTCAHLPAASSVRERLTAAGIPAIVRSLHHRSLWHFYAPYLEMDVLVPIERAEQARELLSGPTPAAEQPRTDRESARPKKGPATAWALAGILVVGIGFSVAEHTSVFDKGPAWKLVYRVAPEPLAEDATFDRTQSPEQGLARDGEVMARRLRKLAVRGASVRLTGDQILIGIPSLPPAERARLQVLLGRRGQLSFRLIDDGTEYMRKLGAYADLHRASYPGLELGYDAWTNHQNGQQHTDVFLQAPDRATLKRFLAQLPPEWAPPVGRSVLLEKLTPATESPETEETEAQHTSFRTYLVEQDAPLTDRDIADAVVAWDKTTGRPEVSLSFTTAAAGRFEELTAAHIGRKLAIILDNELSSAPVIEGRIAGGRAMINLGSLHSAAQLEQEARDLVAILLAGSLPLPLVFEREIPLE